MWVVVAREPRPNAAYWPGRRWLAVVNAVIWPLAWVLMIRHVPGSTGLVGPFVTAVAVLFGLERSHRAMWANHRYRFTTWRWGMVFAALVLMGEVMKLAMAT